MTEDPKTKSSLFTHVFDSDLLPSRPRIHTSHFDKLLGSGKGVHTFLEKKSSQTRCQPTGHVQGLFMFSVGSP